MPEEVEILRGHLRVRWESGAPWIWLDLSTLSQPLRPEIGVDTLTDFDRTVGIECEGVTRHGDCERLTWSARSTLWTKRYHLDIHAQHVEFYAEVTGDGTIDAIRFFDTIPDAGFREHCLLLKHFNDKAVTGARAYSHGSPTAFDQVLCPEPNSYACSVFPAHEYGQISVNADLDYRGGNFVANPGLLCFAVTSSPQQEWLTFGLGVEPGEYLFSEYEYLGGRDFVLRLNSWGARSVTGGFRTPRVIMVPGANAEQALARYVGVLRQSRLVPSCGVRDQAAWWHRPILCGWGHQCYQADLFRIRSSPERPPDNAAYMLSTQASYRDLIERIDAHALPWGTLVIDPRWFQAGGLKDVDEGRWPDLRGFIKGEHRRGRHVLLWWSPWDPEGVPAEECIRYLTDDRSLRRNRPGRLIKFGVPTVGKKLAVEVAAYAHQGNAEVSGMAEAIAVHDCRDALVRTGLSDIEEVPGLHRSS